MGDFVDTGVDAYHHIDVMAGMNLEKIKQEYGENLCLMGNFSRVILEHGSEKEVVREVQRCIDTAAPGGGYIFSVSGAASVETNANNYLSMVKLVKKIWQILSVT